MKNIFDYGYRRGYNAAYKQKNYMFACKALNNKINEKYRDNANYNAAYKAGYTDGFNYYAKLEYSY